MTIQTRTLTIPDLGEVPISFTTYGTGDTSILLLHGGGGPATVTGWAEHAAATLGAQIIVPIHPGFDYTPRPAAVTTIRDIARIETALLHELDLSGVTAIGNSIGGWIAAEIALLHDPQIARLVVLDSVGITVDGHPIPDFFTMTPQELSARTFYDPATYGINPATLPDAIRERMASNRAPLNLYAGTAMADPTLRERLTGITIPTLAIWGAADGIADPDYGRVFAASIPDARFVLLDHAGHLPQIEQADTVTRHVATVLER